MPHWIFKKILMRNIESILCGLTKKTIRSNEIMTYGYCYQTNHKILEHVKNSLYHYLPQTKNFKMAQIGGF